MTHVSRQSKVVWKIRRIFNPHKRSAEALEHIYMLALAAAPLSREEQQHRWTSRREKEKEFEAMFPDGYCLKETNNPDSFGYSHLGIPFSPCSRVGSKRSSVYRRVVVGLPICVGILLLAALAASSLSALGFFTAMIVCCVMAFGAVGVICLLPGRDKPKEEETERDG